MNRIAQIESLRKQHSKDVEDFDFDKAAEIDKKIQEIRNEISLKPKANYKLYNSDFTPEIQREEIREEIIHQNNYITNEKARIIEKFRIRAINLQQQQIKQQNDLEEQFNNELEKELRRSVPEAEKLFNHSKILGHAHQYDEAKKLFSKGEILKSEILDKRRRMCNSNYERRLRKLKAAQQKEIELLKEKEKTALQELTLKKQNIQDLHTLQMRAKFFKETGRTSFEYGHISS